MTRRYRTDASIVPHGKNAREFEHLVELGMSTIDSLRTATAQAAELLGQRHRGQIKPGFTADIIAAEGSPLHNISLLQQVEFVMKEGEVYLHP
ncbi:amidohydrolase family protein [Parendozoicomonas sp. Alg238-R29]|uniref:amidohydrolase family protein n=1 Tax=Parendozoicomonas sp. Alg238-R29 TaxID=2993446 RepID=UPI00248ED2A3|nr:amidohydrolase family protein [Parendozoicomonas sp. Alg238-R29]